MKVKHNRIFDSVLTNPRDMDNNTIISLFNKSNYIRFTEFLTDIIIYWDNKEIV